ncbi:MAG: DNA/RNA non-specific endonuclease [Oscillatoriales cyanobacterium]|nr:MAG: DNA/RNA non-specific endonuclease [Oscillatoriales cyanobacterium]
MCLAWDSVNRSQRLSRWLVSAVALGLTGCGWLASLPTTILDTTASPHLQFGNPSDAIADPRRADNYLLVGRDYALSYNASRGTANWVSWKLSKANLGSVNRQDDFRADDRLPAAWYHVDGNDYRGSGYDRGHLVPSADRTADEASNSSTFLMTNIIPQASKNNRETWRELEEYCRELVNRGYELYVIAGVYGGSKQIANQRVTVPSQTWKVVAALTPGQHPERVTADAIVFAVDVPNTNRISSDWRRYQVSIDTLEAKTQLDLFEVLPDAIEAMLESRIVEPPR